MKKKIPQATTNEAPTLTTGYSSSSVLLPDGTPARRLKPLTIGSKVYYNLCLAGDGTTKRVPAERLRDLLAPAS